MPDNPQPEAPANNEFQAHLDESKPWFDLGRYFLTASAMAAITFVGFDRIFPGLGSLRLGDVDWSNFDFTGLLRSSGLLILLGYSVFLFTRVVRAVRYLMDRLERRLASRPGPLRLLVVVIVTFLFISVVTTLSSLVSNPLP